MKVLLITTCMNNLSLIKTIIKFSQHFIYLTEWFQQQTEFTAEFEAMEVNEMNKCLSKFYVSVRRKDGTFYKRNSLLSVQRSCSLTRDNDKYNLIPLFRYFYNDLNNYTKTIIRLRLVNIGEYSPRLRLWEYSPIFTSPSANNC